MNSDDIPFQGNNPDKITVTTREFRDRGEDHYSLELLPAGVTFDVTRLARRSRELWGELCVTVNGKFKHAKVIEGGILSIGDMNFSSVEARSRRAKLLSDRSQAEGLDWHGFLEEFAAKILAAERRGRPAKVLAESADVDESTESWDVLGFPILQDLPTVIFGSGGSGKSYLATYIAGSLAQEYDVNVLYADWEFSEREHRKRFGKLFQPMPKNVFYARCDKPMRDESDRLAMLIEKHQCKYIICDSMVFAIDGRAEDSEQAGIYFRALRSLKVGSLSIAHTTKSQDDGEKQIFGSVFFTNGARSVWFIERADESARGELQFGLFHRKSNVGERLKPKGFKLTFGARTVIEKVKVEDVDELAAKLPLLDRMKRTLKAGAMAPKTLAEHCNVTQGIIRAMVSRHKSIFIKVGDKVGLLETTKPEGSIGF